MSDHAENDIPSNLGQLNKSGFMSTCDRVVAFYKSIFKETDDVWEQFEKRMKTSCTIVVLEAYPMSSNTKYKRVVGAITI